MNNSSSITTTQTNDALHPMVDDKDELSTQAGQVDGGLGFIGMRRHHLLERTMSGSFPASHPRSASNKQRISSSTSPGRPTVRDTSARSIAPKRWRIL